MSFFPANSGSRNSFLGTDLQEDEFDFQKEAPSKSSQWFNADVPVQDMESVIPHAAQLHATLVRRSSVDVSSPIVGVQPCSTEPTHIAYLRKNSVVSCPNSENRTSTDVSILYTDSWNSSAQNPPICAHPLKQEHMHKNTTIILDSVSPSSVSEQFDRDVRVLPSSSTSRVHSNSHQQQTDPMLHTSFLEDEDTLPSIPQIGTNLHMIGEDDVLQALPLSIPSKYPNNHTNHSNTSSRNSRHRGHSMSPKVDTSNTRRTVLTCRSVSRDGFLRNIHQDSPSTSPLYTVLPNSDEKEISFVPPPLLHMSINDNTYNELNKEHEEEEEHNTHEIRLIPSSPIPRQVSMSLQNVDINVPINTDMKYYNNNKQNIASPLIFHSPRRIGSAGIVEHYLASPLNDAEIGYIDELTDAWNLLLSPVPRTALKNSDGTPMTQLETSPSSIEMNNTRAQMIEEKQENVRKANVLKSASNVTDASAMIGQCCKRDDPEQQSAWIQQQETPTYIKSVVNETDKNGSTALFTCAWYGAVNTAKVLLEAGANVNHVNIRHNQALHLACEKAWLDLIRVFLEYGADVHHMNAQGKTCYDLPQCKPEVKDHVFAVQDSLERSHGGRRKKTVKPRFLHMRKEQKEIAQHQAETREVRRDIEKTGFDTCNVVFKKKQVPIRNYEEAQNKKTSRAQIWLREEQKGAKQSKTLMKYFDIVALQQFKCKSPEQQRSMLQQYHIPVTWREQQMQLRQQAAMMLQQEQHKEVLVPHSTHRRTDSTNTEYTYPKEWAQNVIVQRQHNGTQVKQGRCHVPLSSTPQPTEVGLKDVGMPVRVTSTVQPLLTKATFRTRNSAFRELPLSSTLPKERTSSTRHTVQRETTRGIYTSRKNVFTKVPALPKEKQLSIRRTLTATIPQYMKQQDQEEGKQASSNVLHNVDVGTSTSLEPIIQHTSLFINLPSSPLRQDQHTAMNSNGSIQSTRQTTHTGRKQNNTFEPPHSLSSFLSPQQRSFPSSSSGTRYLSNQATARAHTALHTNMRNQRTFDELANSMYQHHTMELPDITPNYTVSSHVAEHSERNQQEWMQVQVEENNVYTKEANQQQKPKTQYEKQYDIYKNHNHLHHTHDNTSHTKEIPHSSSHIPQDIPIVGNTNISRIPSVKTKWHLTNKTVLEARIQQKQDVLQQRTYTRSTELSPPPPLLPSTQASSTTQNNTLIRKDTKKITLGRSKKYFNTTTVSMPTVHPPTPPTEDIHEKPFGLNLLPRVPSLSAVLTRHGLRKQAAKLLDTETQTVLPPMGISLWTKSDWDQSNQNQLQFLLEQNDIPK